MVYERANASDIALICKLDVVTSDLIPEVLLGVNDISRPGTGIDERYSRNGRLVLDLILTCTSLSSPGLMFCTELGDIDIKYEGGGIDICEVESLKTQISPLFKYFTNCTKYMMN